MMDKGLTRSILLWALWLAIVVGCYLLLTAVLPEMAPMVAAVWITAILCLVAGAIVAAAGWWRLVGFTLPRDWRNPALLILPAAITLLPLAMGLKPVDSGLLGFLVLGYVLTGFAEETMFRGVIPLLLRGRRPWQMAAIASVLFGLAHLGNILIRGEPAVIASQAVGAACFGFGYVAVRMRTNTIVPLIATHLLTDLFLQLGNLPLIPVAVAQDVILLGYGIWLLRGLPAEDAPVNRPRN
jgi:membrane protease YdiL (CAAX protease family)